MAKQQAHHVAAGHKHQGNRAALVYGLFGPAVNGGKFAKVAFHPAQCLLSVPTANEVQRDTSNENAHEANCRIWDYIDVRNGAEQVSVTRTEGKN